MIRHGIAILIALQAATALPTQAPPFGPGDHHRGMGPTHGGRLFISPMGEPFRDAPENAAAWFATADRDHDGRITLAEFRADAMRFFATLDADHDHEIGPDEIDRYEREIAPETSSGGGFGDSRAPEGAKAGRSRGGRGGGGGPSGGMGGGGHGGGMGGHRGGGGADQPSDGEGGSTGTHTSAFDSSNSGAARFSYLALPEPVIAADSDFNRGVSESEFLQAASRRFALLDANHDGAITADELPKLGGETRGAHGHRGPKPPPEE